MIIQYVLLAAVFAGLFALVRHRGTMRAAAWAKIAFLLFVAFGVYAVLRPDDVSLLARWLGVGRGTDLLVYAVVAAFAFSAVNTYLRFKEIEGRYAQLVRAVALRDTTVPGKSTPDSDGGYH